MTPEEIMRVAIAQAESSQTPFGAVIVKDNQIVARAGNTVEPDADPSAHAEVNAIRQLTSKLGNASLAPGYILYTTCEPCPMCAAMCFWAGISEIVYGVGGNDFPDAYNPNMINISCENIIAKSPNSIAIQGGILKSDCQDLHQKYPL